MTTSAQSTPRLFVSHSSKDQTFAERLAVDLRQAGAEAWIFEADDRAGIIMERINEMLAQCDWLVLVLSPHAVQSRWVRMEVFAALDLVQKERMRGVIPVLLREVDLSQLPTWEALRRFNADSEAVYPEAVASVLRAVGLSPQPQPDVHPTTPLLPTTALASAGAASEPGTSALEQVTADPALEAIYQEGLAARAAGDLQRAGKLWERVLGKDPDFDHGRLARQMRNLAIEYRPIGINELRASAQKAASGGDWTTAITKWNELLRLEPNDLAGRKGLQDALRNRAEQAHAARAWADEINAWQAVLHLESASGEARARLAAAEIQLRVEQEALAPPTPTPPAPPAAQPGVAKSGDQAVSRSPSWMTDPIRRARSAAPQQSGGLLGRYNSVDRTRPGALPPDTPRRARDAASRRGLPPSPASGTQPMPAVPAHDQVAPARRSRSDNAWDGRRGRWDDDWDDAWTPASRMPARDPASARVSSQRSTVSGRRLPPPREKRASYRFVVWLALLMLLVGIGGTTGMLTRSSEFALIALGLGLALAYLALYRRMTAIWSSLLAGALAAPVAWLTAAHASALPWSGVYRAHVLFVGPGNTHPAVAQLWAVLAVGVALGVMPPLVVALLDELDGSWLKKAARRYMFIALLGVLPGLPYLAVGIALGLSIGGKRALLLSLALALGVYVVSWVIQAVAGICGLFVDSPESMLTVALPMLAASALYHYFLLSLFGQAWFGVTASLGLVVAAAIILAGGIGLAVLVRVDV